MNIKEKLYIRFNKKYLLQTTFEFGKNALSNSVVLIYPGFYKDERIWEKLILAKSIQDITKGKIILDSGLIPFYLYLKGNKEDIVLMNNIKEYEENNTIYISLTDDLKEKEKYIITVLKSKYRYNPFLSEEPFFNLFVKGNNDLSGFKILWNLDIKEYKWELNIKKEPKTVFTDKYKDKMKDRYSGYKFYIYKGPNNNLKKDEVVQKMINAETRILKDKYLKLFCKDFNID